MTAVEDQQRRGGRCTSQRPELILDAAIRRHPQPADHDDPGLVVAKVPSDALQVGSRVSVTEVDELVERRGQVDRCPGPLEPDDVRAPPSLRRRQPQRR